jgi:large subunit ribosomal protein L30
MENGYQCLFVIRLRGEVNLRGEIEDTLKMLHLTKVNHAVIINNRPEYVGMLNKVKDVVTWGEISKETIIELIKKRGRLSGGRRFKDETIKELGYDSIEDLAGDLYSVKLEVSKLHKIKPVFRLHPPKGGFKGGTKRSVGDKGELGYRGDAINSLARIMI